MSENTAIEWTDNLTEDDRKRFLVKLECRSASVCWPWKAYIGTAGYGMFHVGKKDDHPRHAHRVSYALFKGPIPIGAHVLHSCDNRWCCNPSHLRLGTAKDNAIDKVLRGRYSNGNEKKTHCPKGHPYQGSNLMVSRHRAWRSCRICQNANARRRWRMRAEKSAPIGGVR